MFIKNNYPFDDLEDIKQFYYYMRKLFYHRTIEIFIKVFQSFQGERINIYHIEKRIKIILKQNSNTKNQKPKSPTVKETQSIDYIIDKIKGGKDEQNG